MRYIDYECAGIQRFSPNRFARIHFDSRSMSQISTPETIACKLKYSRKSRAGHTHILLQYLDSKLDFKNKNIDYSGMHIETLPIYASCSIVKIWLCRHGTIQLNGLNLQCFKMYRSWFVWSNIRSRLIFHPIFPQVARNFFYLCK